MVNLRIKKTVHSAELCSYHSCENGAIAPCDYCHRRYCGLHLKPTAPSMPFRDSKEHLRWSIPNVHPCPAYVARQTAEEENEKEVQRSALDNYLRNSSNQPHGSRYVSWDNEVDYSSSYVNREKVSQKSRNNAAVVNSIYYGVKQFFSNNKLKILLLIVLLVFLFSPPSSKRDTEIKLSNFVAALPIKFCKDWTLYNTCSLNKLYYCDNGTLIQKASLCGCQHSYEAPEGDSCLDLRNPDPQRLALTIHKLINEQRIENGLGELAFDNTLQIVSTAHSKDMALRNFFAHVNPDGLDPTARANQIGYSCYKNYGSFYTTGIAENIAQSNTFDSTTYTNGVESNRHYLTPDEISFSVVNGWMHSPGHRQNILTPTYDREAIGIYVDSDGKVYATENFC